MADETPKKSIIKDVKAAVVKLATHDGDHEPPPPWINYVAMLTGVLAGLAGFLTVRSTTLTNTAIYESNQAILAQAQSSDAWAEYQADSIKARIVETQLLVTGSTINPDDRAKLEAGAQDLRTRQPKIQQEAQAKAAERDAHLEQGQSQLQTRDLISYANLAVQLGIALASVAAIVRLRRAFEVAVVVGVTGVLIAAYALGRQFL